MDPRVYSNSPGMAQAYRKLNGLTHLEWGRHHTGAGGWQVWLMAGPSGGWPMDFPTLLEAKKAAEEISQVLSVPIQNP